MLDFVSYSEILLFVGYSLPPIQCFKDFVYIEPVLVEKKDIDKMEDLSAYSIDRENKKSERSIIIQFLHVNLCNSYLKSQVLSYCCLQH